MKCAVVLSVLLASCSALLGDSPDPASSSRRSGSVVLEDLVRMTRAGSSDASVLAYARARRRELPAEMSDATLRWLRNSGVSERVVRYMAAIDVRASDVETPEGVAERSDIEEEGTRSRGGYSADNEDDAGPEDVLRGDVATDAGGYGDRYRAGDAYADYGYDAGYDYAYDPYPYFGYAYPYSFFPPYFIGRGDFFRRFPRRDRGGRRDHRFDGGHRRDRGDGGRFHESWRDRGFRGSRRDTRARDSRGFGRPTFARGLPPGAPGGRGRTIEQRGSGHPGWGRAHSSPGIRGSRGGAAIGFRHSSPSGGSHARGGGGSNRGAPGRQGGGRGRR